MNSGENIAAETAGPQHADLRTCPNCGAGLAERFCGRCGQEDPGDRGYTFWSFSVETWHAFRGRESIPRAVWRLLTQPGVLTDDFVRGHRIRHPNPLRIFVTCLSACAALVALAQPESAAVAALAAAMPEIDPAELERYLWWGFGAAKAAYYATYVFGMAAMAGLLRMMVPADRARPLADIVLPIHLLTVAVLLETAVQVLTGPLGAWSGLLSVAATIVGCALWFGAAIRRVYGLPRPTADRMVLVATVLFAPAYLLGMVLTVAVVLVVLLPLMFQVAAVTG